MIAKMREPDDGHFSHQNIERIKKIPVCNLSTLSSVFLNSPMQFNPFLRKRSVYTCRSFNAFNAQTASQTHCSYEWRYW